MRSCGRLLAAACLAAAVAPGSGTAQNFLPRFEPSREIPPVPDLAPPRERGPVLPVPEPPRRVEPGAGSGPRVTLSGLAFEGNTVFSDAELAAAVPEIVGRPVAIEDLEAARRRLTALYIEAGYVASGVLIPEQDVADGVLRFSVVEGRLGEIRVTGEGVGTDIGPLGDLHPDYVRSRLAGDPEAPLRLEALEERFRVLLQDPAVAQLNGALGPGRTPGEAALALEVVPADPLELAIGYDNFDPSSTGTHTGFVDLTLRNSTGFGDALGLRGEISRGRQSGTLSFAGPIGTLGLRGFVEIEGTRTRVIEAPFDPLDIESEYYRGTLGIAWDAVRTSARTLTIDASLDVKSSTTTLLGERFSFSPGAVNGRSRATVLRLGQEYVFRGAEDALAARSSVSVGLDLFNATENPDGVPDGQFASWLGQVYYVRQLPLDLSLSLQAVSQVAFQPLLAFEQIELGGAESVRGYRESALSQDSVAYATLGLSVPLADLRLPRIEDPAHAGSLALEPFVSAGISWSHGAFAERSLLVGAGADLVWQVAPGTTLALGFGAPLLTDTPGLASDLENLRGYAAFEVRF